MIESQLSRTGLSKTDLLPCYAMAEASLAATGLVASTVHLLPAGSIPVTTRERIRRHEAKALLRGVE